MILKAFLLALAFLVATPGTSSAALTIDITQGVEGALPVAVVPFGVDGSAQALPADVAATIAADLRSSGRFAPLADNDLVSRPTEGKDVNFRDWRLIGVPSLVIGKVRTVRPDQYEVQFQLFDVFKGSQLAGFRFSASGPLLRNVAHQISDIIYEKLTGERGAFTTRIAFVVVQGQGKNARYSLQISDIDGYNPQEILESPAPVMSPAWSPDGTRLAYVSFEKRQPQIFIQEITTGKRELVSSHRGMNSAPAWSPDGRRMAMVLSKDGNPEVYVLDLQSRALQRITEHFAIDTEPAWAPDGNSLIFTSDRGGKPQLYRYEFGSGRVKRATFEGEYNARGVFTPDGRRLAMVHQEGRQYRIAVMEIETGALQVLTRTGLDESPSIAPNGSIIIYATRDKGKGVLAMVSVDGRVHQRLGALNGDVREPAWSPFNRK